MAEIKEKTREEILSEKTERERFFAGCRIEKMQEEYEDAKKEVVFNDVVAVIPRSGEYYSKIAKDKTGYLKRLDKIIRDVMTASLKKRDEERMKKNVEELVDDLKKVVEEVKVEAVKEEDVKIAEEEKVEEKVVEKEAVTEEQQVEEVEKKMESSVEVNSDAGAGDEKRKDVDQTQKDAEENTEESITEVLLKNSECQQEECRSSLARKEEAADPCDG
ncbi:ring-infected erythrocyte surface antigen-like [Helianthus annuus]|uniref:ring-infected erythrocyte surface antigen-like n=1 Tax=Helianthus annuus TaxID=4232 RepID=UPI001652C8D6|nr:ring-infected erythrocyte surface antigen-like [Helianthus annuus]